MRIAPNEIDVFTWGFFCMKLQHLIAALCCAACTTGLAQSRFSMSADGQEVIDAKTGLVWRRCAEGMTANSKGCTGSAYAMTYEGAQDLAQRLSTETGRS